VYRLITGIPYKLCCFLLLCVLKNCFYLSAALNGCMRTMFSGHTSKINNIDPFHIVSGEGGRPTVAFCAAEEDPSSTGQVGREIRRGESRGKGPETTQSRSKDDPLQVTFPRIW